MSSADLLDEEKACETFLVTREWGFLQLDVATQLPEPCNVWVDLAKNLEDLLPQRQVRSQVDRLEEISTAAIESSVKLLRLAYTCLSKITMLYVWQDLPEGEPSKRLPRQVAVPLCKVSDALSLPPIMSYPALIIFNLLRPNPEAPISFDNYEQVCTVNGGDEGRIFFAVAVELEVENGKNIAAVFDIAHAMKEKDYAQVTSSLRHIETTTRQFKEILKLYHGRVDGKMVYTQLLSFLTGWAPPSPLLPEGLLYEGVSSEPIQCISSSAGQSPVFQTLDSLFGIEHDEEGKGFFAQKRLYMLPEHRAFIDAVRGLGFQKFVEESGDPEMKLALRACVDALVAFRSYHIQIVAKFMIIPAAKQKKELEIRDRGFGQLIPLLKGIKQSTVDTNSKHAST